MNNDYVLFLSPGVVVVNRFDFNYVGSSQGLENKVTFSKMHPTLVFSSVGLWFCYRSIIQSKFVSVAFSVSDHFNAILKRVKCYQNKRFRTYVPFSSVLIVKSVEQW